MSDQNPFLQSPYDSIINRPAVLMGNEPTKDAPVPDIPAAQGEPASPPPAAPSAPSSPAPGASLVPPKELRDVFAASAAHFNVPENVLMAMAQQESTYNPTAENPESGARGIAGYMKATADKLGINRDDPNEAIPAAAMQLRERLDKGMSLQDAVSEHFAGPNRKLWGPKTAAYGQEVLAKADAIGKELYGDAPADAGNPASPDVPEAPDTAQNQFAATRLRRADYLAEFKKLNPKASQPAIDAVMAQYDKQVADAGAARAAKATGPAPIPSAEQFFDQRLDARLKGKQKGIVPQLPGYDKPDLSDTGTAPAEPSTFDTVAGNLTGGALHTIVGAIASGARLLGADDVADEWEQGKKDIQKRQQELGGDTFKGKVAGLIGGVLPAMAASSEHLVLQFVNNAGLFGVPAFEDTYKAKLAEGQSPKLAAIHAMESFGLNTVGPMIMPRGVGALMGKAGAAGATGAKAAGLGLAQAAGEGVAFSGLSTVMDKGTDVLAGQENSRPWIDPEDMAVQAAGFGAMRAGHMAGSAVASRMPEPQLRGAEQGSGPAPAQQESQQNQELAPQEVPNMAPAGPAPGASVADQLRAVRPLGPLESAVEHAALSPSAGPMESAIVEAAAAHAENPAPLPVDPAVQAAPPVPDYTAMPVEQLRARMKEVAQQAAANPDQRKELQAERKKIEQEIGARGDAAKANSKPATEELIAGPFDDMKAANKMMERFATETGQAHEVVKQGEGFVVKPMGEVGNGVDTAGTNRGSDGRGPSGDTAGGVGRADGKGSGRTGSRAVEGGKAELAAPAAQGMPDAGRDRTAANGAAHDADAVANPHATRRFPDQAKAEAFLSKQPGGEQFKAVQTGQVRWEITPRAAPATYKDTVAYWNADRPTETVTLKDGTKATIAVRDGNEIDIFVDGKRIGNAALGAFKEGPGVADQHVDEAWRRKGVATALHDYMRRNFVGFVPRPHNQILTPDGAALSDALYPKAKEKVDVSQRQEVPEEAQAARGAESTPAGKARTSLADARTKHERQDAVVKAAAEKLAARNAEKEQAPKSDGIAGALNDVIKSEQAVADDWASRSYKKNKKQVELKGDGPANAGSMSVSGINERRRDLAVQSALSNVDAAKKMLDQISSPDRNAALMERMVDLYNRLGDGGFESAFLDGLGMRPPGGRGAVSSNPLSRAVKVAVKAEVEARSKKAAEQVPPESSDNSGNWLEELYGDKSEQAEPQSAARQAARSASPDVEKVAPQPAAAEAPAPTKVETKVEAKPEQKPEPKAEDTTPAAIKLTIGKTPNSAEAVTVKDGVVHIGDYPAQNYDTGADVTVPKGSTAQHIKDALIEAGAIGKGQKVFGLPKGEQAETVLYDITDKPQTLAEVREAWDAAGIKNFISEKNGTIHLSQIVVPKEARGEGAGTKAMQQLVEYADRTGQRVVLTPSADFGGSKSRLVEFYKRFGFVENKGRNKDFEVSESMYREPQESKLRDIKDRDGDRREKPRGPDDRRTIEVDGVRRPIRDADGRAIGGGDFMKQQRFWQWFGDSKAVDEAGRPLVAYHGTDADFSTFDAEKIGSTTDDGYLGKGFYFSTDPRVIGKRNVGMPVYLRAENPLIVKMPDFKTDKRTLVPADLGDHDAVILDYSPTGYDHKEIMVRSPEQIKSATGNDGTYSPTDANITRDITPLMRDNRAVLGRQPAAEGRGPEQVRAELVAARDAGEIDKATADFALWALDKSPSLANDLRLNVKAPGELGAAGSYQSAQRIMTLFKGNENPGTAVHEILHHSERMMPAAIQGEILKAWRKAYEEAYSKADAKTRAALEDMLNMSKDRDAAGRVIQAFRDGTLEYGEHYQLSNASEYWAVNATRIMAARHGANTWQAKAANWLREMAQKVKGLLGLPSDAPILKGLNEVLAGTGKELSPKMLVEQGNLDVQALRDLAPKRRLSGSMAMQRALYEGRDSILDKNDRLAVDRLDAESNLTDAEFDKMQKSWQESAGVPLSEADAARVVARVNSMQWFHGSRITDAGELGLHSDGGLFLTSDRNVADHYAGGAGRTYDRHVNVRNPFFVEHTDATRDMEMSGEIKKLAAQGFDAIVPLDYGDIVILNRSAVNDPALRDITAPRPGEPETPDVPDTMRAKLARIIGRPVATLRSAAHNAAMLVVPMEAGSVKARAVAKDFANQMRQSQAQWNAFDTILRKNYTEKQLADMWTAADQENDLRREGKTSATKGLNSLPADQRETVEVLHAYGEQLWERAKRAGLVSEDAEGVHYWTPRVAANIYADGSVDSIRGTPGEFSKDAKNLRTSASSTKQRKHETTAESEAALKAKLGDDAAYVKNIRVMPMAMAQLEKAIAGRTLVNQIKAHGQATGQDLISETGGPGFVTFDHPALKRWAPRMHEVDGKWAPVTDSDGNVILDPHQLFVSKDFAGPLRAVFQSSLGNEALDKTYRGLMQLKGASMSVIMISPMTHNAVIWGKAMPSLISSMGWKNNLKNIGTLGAYTYINGHQLRKDHALVSDLIAGGLVPMGGRGMNPDVASIAEGLKPGKSLLAKALGAVLDPVSPKAGDAARKGVDAAGHFWHETLLWDRIGDMQVGMAVQMRNHFMDQGLDQYVATRIATHFANRYAGAIPQEALSQGAHALLNTMLFSKSFTGTNLGAMKDPIAGLPSDVRAQIREHFAAINRALGKTDIEAEDAAGKVLKQAQSVTRKKAGMILAADFGAMAIVTTLLQAAFKGQNADDFKKDLLERAHELGAKLDKENPLDFLGPKWGLMGLPLAALRHPFDNLEMLSQTHDNPHGKQDRIRLGEDEHGNSYYMRLPVGKVVEEMKSYMNLSNMTDMLSNKLSPLAKGVGEAVANKDFSGRSVYSKDANLLTQIAQSIGHVVKAQVPYDDMVALKNLATENEHKGGKVNIGGAQLNMDEAKLMGTATGLSVSKMTGGDAVAEMRYQAREQQAKINDVMPDVKDAVMRGDTDKAEKLLEDAGQTQREIRDTIKRIENPDFISKSRMRRFNQHATDEQAERVSRMMK